MPVDRRVRMAVAQPWLIPPRIIRSKGIICASSLLIWTISSILSCSPGIMSSFLSSGVVISQTSNHWDMISSPFSASANELLLNSKSRCAEYRSLVLGRPIGLMGRSQLVYGRLKLCCQRNIWLDQSQSLHDREEK